MHYPRATHRTGWFRAGLGLLAALSAVIGGWAFFAPEAFYTAFPGFGHTWIAFSPPYNEHLVRDVGEFNLSFALLFLWAAIAPEVYLVRASLAAYLVYAVPHLIYHATHLMHYPPDDATAQVTALALALALPLALLVASVIPHPIRARTLKSAAPREEIRR